MMKKFITCLFLMLVPSVCFSQGEHWVNENGEEVSDEEVGNFVFDNLSDTLKQAAAEMEIIYESMNTCMPGKSEYLEIFGFEGNLCHFRYADYDCYVPQDVAAEYSELGLKLAKDLSYGIISTESPENARMQKILSDTKYCSYASTWTITTEDENGHEIPFSGVQIE